MLVLYDDLSELANNGVKLSSAERFDSYYIVNVTWLGDNAQRIERALSCLVVSVFIYGVFYTPKTSITLCFCIAWFEVLSSLM